MKVFIIGLPKSGKTTVSRQLVSRSADEWFHISSVDWLRHTFRAQMPNETDNQFDEAYHAYVVNRLKDNPDIIINNVYDSISSIEKLNDSKYNWIIEGVFNPKDFCRLFDYNTDVVVFLNRIDGETDSQDYESIGVSVMRDYCFWLSSANMLPKSRWLEYNFRIPGEKSDSMKVLGSKNTVYIFKSIENVIDHLVDYIKDY